NQERAEEPTHDRTNRIHPIARSRAGPRCGSARPSGCAWLLPTGRPRPHANAVRSVRERHWIGRRSRSTEPVQRWAARAPARAEGPGRLRPRRLRGGGAALPEALPLFERALGPEDLRLVGPLANLADVYRALAKFDRAEVLYARLAFLMQEAFGPSDIHLGTALASTAEVVASQGQYARAKNLYQRALSI